MVAIDSAFAINKTLDSLESSNVTFIQMLRRNIISKGKSIISGAVGSAFSTTLGFAPIASVAKNPFSIQPLEKGYMATDTGKHGKMKIDEGKCGASMANTNKDDKDYQGRMDQAPRPYV